MAEVPFYTFEKTFPKGLFRQFKRNLVLIPKNNQWRNLISYMNTLKIAIKASEIASMVVLQSWYGTGWQM